MKRLTIIAALIALLSGCEKPTPNPEETKDVTVSLTYSLDTSVGSDMTKATDAEVFDMFYQKMKSGEMVASKYHIVFTEVSTGAKYEFDGSWADDDMVTIRTGNYRIEGYTKADGRYIQEKASLKFEEELNINSSMTSITLRAKYDCFLLAFAQSNIKDMRLYYRYYGDSSYSKLYTFNGYYYAFCNNVLYSDEPNRKEQACISGERDNGTIFSIYVGHANLEKGKYYIYNDVSGSFELPKMEAGK